MTDESAFEEYTAPVGDNALARLSGLASQQASIESEIADLEAQIDQKKNELKEVAERQLPELMDELGMKEFTTSSGLKIKVEEIVAASISKANNPEAMAWLRAHKLQNLIKRKIAIEVSPDEFEKGDQAVEKLVTEGYDVTDDQTVPNPTLRKLVRDRLSEGEEIPVDLFGVHRVRRTKIK